MPAVGWALLLAVAACCLRVSQQQMGDCGHCFCAELEVACSLNKKVSADAVTLDLAEIIPSAPLLLNIGMDPLVFEVIYVNCRSQKSKVRNQRLTRQHLQHFKNVKKIEIMRCDLTEIEPDAFSQLDKLQNLDLTDNGLRSLPPRLFSSLTMQFVKLSENTGLRLQPDTFSGAYVRSLKLSECSLTEFPLQALLPISGLSELILTNNQIRFVPKAALSLINSLSLFYIDGNHLSCTCGNRWMRESVDWNRLAKPVREKQTVPACWTPSQLNGTFLPELPASEFVCSAPHIVGLQLSVSQQSAQLLCSAQVPDEYALADEASETAMRWSVYGDSAADAAPGAGRGPSFGATLSRGPGAAVSRWLVAASKWGGPPANCSVTVRWPPTPAAGGGGQGGEFLDFNNPRVMYNV